MSCAGSSPDFIASASGGALVNPQVESGRDDAHGFSRTLFGRAGVQARVTPCEAGTGTWRGRGANFDVRPLLDLVRWEPLPIWCR